MTLVDNWKQGYKFYSIWFFAVLGLLPDLFNLAVSMGVFDADEVPVALARIINLVAFFGAAFRLIKQNVEVKQGQLAEAGEET